MRRSFLAAVLLAFKAITAQETSIANDSDEDFFSRCGNSDPSDLIMKAQQDLNKEAAEAPEPANADGRRISVKTYFHVVESQSKEGSITKLMLDDQLTVLNSDYGRYGITFNLIDTTWAVNDSWSSGTHDEEMKKSMHQGSYADLNLYFLTALEGDILGICPFPAYPSTLTEEGLYMDGCKVLAGALPGGDIPNYNKGRTATHEVGHWFGLLHPFQGESCEGDGDGVEDTPQQDSPTLGCPTSRDTCEELPGLDNVHNYMDYSYDDCYELLTPGQVTKLFQMWDFFRSGL